MKLASKVAGILGIFLVGAKVVSTPPAEAAKCDTGSCGTPFNESIDQCKATGADCSTLYTNTTLTWTWVYEQCKLNGVDARRITNCTNSKTGCCWFTNNNGCPSSACS